MSVKVYIGKSPIAGRGVFAGQDFKKDEVVFIFEGEPINFVVKNKKDALFGAKWIGIDKGKWLKTKGFGAYLNHFCDPNCGIDDRAKVVALRDLTKGEEVTIDYAITESEKLWQMTCRCGSKECRKIIRSVQFLPSHVYDKYYPHVPKFAQIAYSSYNH